MKKIRAIFETNGVARFISHLDLNRVMQYALRRSNLPIWYTEGFNQHIYLTFSNPISLGFLNKCGIMEIKLTDDDFDSALVAPALNRCLPDSITVSESYESERKFTEIAFSDYMITLDSESPQNIISGLHRSEIIAVKKGKAGEKEVNLAPFIKWLKTDCDGNKLTIRMRLPASVQFNVNPKLLLDAVSSITETPICHLIVTRLELLDSNGKKFR